MEIIQGKSIYPAIAMGKIQYITKQDFYVQEQEIEDVSKEIAGFEAALAAAKQQILSLYEQAQSQVGNQDAEIFKMHLLMLEDTDYLNSITQRITSDKVSAAFAVQKSSQLFSVMFSSMEDEYMKARATDITDISDRILSILLEQAQDLTLTEPIILLADDLTPSQTIQLDKSKLLAIVLKYGSANSHSAILAKTMGIPALYGVDIKDGWQDSFAIINGHSGQLILNPTDAILSQMTIQMESEQKNRTLLKELKGKETITKDGRKVRLYANIGHVNDCKEALMQDAEGIGLLRSEFLYMEATNYPSEEDQFLIYKNIAQTMEGKKVIIRTLDIGADKQAEYFKLEREENPAMGVRGIRVCLTKQEVFKTQLRAILRASVYGDIAIMLPMINSISEIQKTKELLSDVKRELNEKSLPFKNIELGIMIETPAAVMISDLLAKEVDFFSIGTNDLSQYSLAIDRQNHLTDPFFDPYHEAIFRMIELTIRNGHENGIWVGICGELAADTQLSERFIRMGIDELSVSPSYLLGLRKQIRSLTIG